MNPEIKERWVKALREGEYRQGKHELHSANGSFCCLGVLCDIVKEEIGLEWQHNEPSRRYSIYNPVSQTLATGHLPKEVMAYCELPMFLSDCLTYDIYPTGPNDKSLSALNDSGATFAQIADIIEENL